ncbi:unnamed protein product [Phytophthora fragariaefolia]|uniref:Unnamed protein product n=1 Tax=Phytophthora fragariaefolia TaxID=1490495 RepID=A0A9W6YR66_9STRA|nr:unnamed protein product [Phytophthora fragariaefolia]
MADNILSPTRPQATFTPRQIAGFFFKTCLDEEGVATGYKSCKACGKCRKHLSGTGYTNLVSHVRSAHPKFEVDMRNASAAATGTLVSWVSQKGSNRYAWLRWIVMSNLPLSFCESELTRQFTSLPAVSVDTLRANMESVTRVVERLIGAEMPQKLGFILDGWSHGTEQYLAVYGCYETPDGPRYPLLSMAPVMQDEDVRLTAESHMAAIARFLPFFGKTLSDCLFLVGDNCAVNKRLANLMGVPLVGCASHRLNLAVKSHLAPHEDDLEKVQVLMRKLRTLKQAAKLRAKTALAPVLRQETRWSSTFAMLDRYVRLREFLSADDEDIADLLPTRAAHRRLEALRDEMKDVESISKKLQSEGLTLLQARDLFDGLLELKPDFASYLGTWVTCCFRYLWI